MWLSHQLNNSKNVFNVLHAELGHPLDVFTRVTGQAMGFHITCVFMFCEDCALGKAKKAKVSKRLLSTAKYWEKGYSSTTLTQIFAGKKHWLLVMKDSTDLKLFFKGRVKVELCVVVLN